MKRAVRDKTLTEALHNEARNQYVSTVGQKVTLSCVFLLYSVVFELIYGHLMGFIGTGLLPLKQG